MRISRSFILRALACVVFFSQGVQLARADEDIKALMAEEPRRTKKAAAKTPASRPASKTSSKPTVAKEPDRNAEEIETAIVADQLELLKFVNGRLQHLRYYQERNCDSCFAASAGTGVASLDKKSSDEVCKKTWKDYYSKPIVNITFSFGYGDFYDDSVAWDLIRRQTLISKVTAPCEDNNLVQACGFSGTDDGDVFEKSVTGPEGKTHTVRLKLVASSFNVSDRINRSFVEEQQQASKKAADAFYDAYDGDETALYIGHARDSGGPDFAPAKRKPDGKIDYDHYRLNRPGLEEFYRRTLDKKKTPKILGFLACDSQRWATSMGKRAPKSGLLLAPTDKVAPEVPVAQAYALLDSILWQRCEKSFNEAINQIDTYDGKPVLPLTFSGFFKAE